VTRWEVIAGDCLDVLRAMPDASIDAVVTDPPYGLSEHKPAEVAACLTAWLAGEPYIPKGRGFMGRTWDAWVPGPEVWREVLRVLKPGGHAVIFAGSRTQDLMGMAVRLAGFEVRDTLQWLYGSGFPKSLDVSKAIDAAAGAVREVVGVNPSSRPNSKTIGGRGFDTDVGHDSAGVQNITAPATPEAAQWAGWGTALKPAHEPIILARKPLGGTVAACVLAHGTGALNVDGCRIGTSKRVPGSLSGGVLNGYGGRGGGDDGTGSGSDPNIGRWPANVIMDETAAAMLDEQSGERPCSGAARTGRPATAGRGACVTSINVGMVGNGTLHNDSGGASRFFYVAKASRAERAAGVTAEPQPQDPSRVEGAPGGDNPRNRGAAPRANSHPTVKPIALMRWLVRLVTPPGGVVLDPFAGSGTTGCAAVAEGARFVGIEREAEYVEIARGRIADAAEDARIDAAQLTLGLEVT